MKKSKHHIFKYDEYSATIRLMPANYMIASKEKGHWIADIDVAIEDDDAAQIFVLIRNSKFNKQDDLVSKLNIWLGTSDVRNIYRFFGEYLSEDEENYPAILQSLRIALTEEPYSLIDYIEYTETDGINTSTISVWEKVESVFTVKDFCQLAGITN